MKKIRKLLLTIPATSIAASAAFIAVSCGMTNEENIQNVKPGHVEVHVPENVNNFNQNALMQVETVFNEFVKYIYTAANDWNKIIEQNNSLENKYNELISNEQYKKESLLYTLRTDHKKFVQYFSDVKNNFKENIETKLDHEKQGTIIYNSVYLNSLRNAFELMQNFFKSYGPVVDSLRDNNGRILNSDIERNIDEINKLFEYMRVLVTNNLSTSLIVNETIDRLNLIIANSKDSTITNSATNLSNELKTTFKKLQDEYAKITSIQEINENITWEDVKNPAPNAPRKEIKIKGDSNATYDQVIDIVHKYRIDFGLEYLKLNKNATKSEFNSFYIINGKKSYSEKTGVTITDNETGEAKESLIYKDVFTTFKNIVSDAAKAKLEKELEDEKAKPDSTDKTNNIARIQAKLDGIENIKLLQDQYTKQGYLPYDFNVIEDFKPQYDFNISSLNFMDISGADDKLARMGHISIYDKEDLVNVSNTEDAQNQSLLSNKVKNDKYRYYIKYSFDASNLIGSGSQNGPSSQVPENKYLAANLSLVNPGLFAYNVNVQNGLISLVRDYTKALFSLRTFGITQQNYKFNIGNDNTKRENWNILVKDNSLPENYMLDDNWNNFFYYLSDSYFLAETFGGNIFDETSLKHYISEIFSSVDFVFPIPDDIYNELFAPKIEKLKAKQIVVDEQLKEFGKQREEAMNELVDFNSANSTKFELQQIIDSYNAAISKALNSQPQPIEIVDGKIKRDKLHYLIQAKIGLITSKITEEENKIQTASRTFNDSKKTEEDQNTFKEAQEAYKNFDANVKPGLESQIKELNTWLDEVWKPVIDIQNKALAATDEVSKLKENLFKNVLITFTQDKSK
ncbi:hypothetical protein H9M94_03210 [Mycoplasma sp. Pen4]|uniref:hypothetical protein n=1 Tax=Mycoplasma sp. Pen4 TaxID=640330 RepID=UPI001654A0EA|nr:hypothetical protein [Mycoplasma sp. Pen4]QNM93587.1 hypothetical protein H9M94_03210 [Mycoplasma sp. Pen4]